MEEQRKNYYDYLAKVQEAREQMTLGWDSIKSDYQQYPFLNRVKDRARNFGLIRPELNSIYSPNEQISMAKSDAISNGLVRGLDLGMGALQLSTMLLPTTGKIATISGYGSIAASVAGMGGLATGLGTIATWSNPWTAAASIGMKTASFGIQESILNPLSNSRMYGATVNTAFRDKIGGLVSNTGRGGFSLGESYNLSRSVESIRTNNRDISPDKLNQFLDAASNLPQVQNATSVDRAVENVSKFMDIMVKLSKQFKGKENELVQSITQFSQMGMSLQEAERNIQSTSRLGTILGVNSSNIMLAGASTAQGMMGTNISQSVGYYLGSQSYVQAEIMRQRGQISQTQLMNLGGTNGISQILASAQNNILTSNLSNIFLKSVYEKQIGGTGAGVNFDLVNKLASGSMGLEEARNRAAGITLSPEANMQFQFDKESIISSLGDKSFDVSNQIFNKLAARNPYGNTLQGRAKFAMQTGIAPDMNSARLFAQMNMTYNPIVNDVVNSYKQDQFMAGMDPYYTNTPGFNTWGRDVERDWRSATRDTFGFLNETTAAGVNFRRNMGGIITGGIGDDAMNFYEKLSTTRNIKGFTPFEGVKDGADLIKNYEQSLNNISNQSSVNKVGKTLLYSDYDRLSNDSRDVVRNYEDKLLTQFGQKNNSRWFGKVGDIMEKDKISNPDELLRKAKGYSSGIMKTLPEDYFMISDYGTKLSKDEVSRQFEGMYMENFASDNLKNISKESIAADADTKLKRKGITVTADSLIKGVLYNGPKLWDWSKIFSDPGNYAMSKFGKSNFEFDAFADKFNGKGVKGKYDMVTKLASMDSSNWGDYGIENFGSTSMNDETKQELLNTDIAKKYLAISKLPEDQRKLALDNELKTEIGKNTANSINTIFGSRGYQDMSLKYGGSNLIKGIVRDFLKPGTAQREDLRMTEEQLRIMKRDLKGSTGLGEIIQYGKISNGYLEIDESNMSKNTKDRLSNNLLAKHNGAITEMNIHSSAKELWESGRGGKATTIQDYAVAVARGMQIYNGNDNLNGWNNVSN